MLEAVGGGSIRPAFTDSISLRLKIHVPAIWFESNSKYRLSPEQVNAILDMQLHRLTGLEQDKLQLEFKEILSLIAELQSILDNFEKLMQVIKDELVEIRDTYGDERRTEIVDNRNTDFSRADLIPEQTIVLTVSRTGYAKTQPISDYVAQKRGGKGKSATAMKEDDVIDHMVVTSTHNNVMIFTTKGRVFSLFGYEVPLASRGSRGRPIVNLIGLNPDENVTAILPVTSDNKGNENSFVFFATASGMVKRVQLSQFKNLRSNGLRAVELKDGDSLIGVAITDGEQQIMLFSNEGKAIRFDESKIRAMGRTAKGVRGISVTLLENSGLDEDDVEIIEDDSNDSNDTEKSVVTTSRVVSLVVAPITGDVLCACRMAGKTHADCRFPD